MSNESSCGWCGAPCARRKKWCTKKCRQTAWRSRQLNVHGDANSPPLRLMYADPPYLGLAHKYYRREPTYGGEVDHEALIAELVTYDGWALSCSKDSLRTLLPMCPPEVDIAPWCKPIGVPRATHGSHNTWEPILFMPARKLQPGFRDWLRAMPARGGGTLIGRKPIAFCAFLFKLLGACPQDSLHDAFPGSGIVTRAWTEFQRGQLEQAVAEDLDDAQLVEASP